MWLAEEEARIVVKALRKLRKETVENEGVTYQEMLANSREAVIRGGAKQEAGERLSGEEEWYVDEYEKSWQQMEEIVQSSVKDVTDALDYYKSVVK